MKNKSSRVVKYILLAMPFVLGMVGFFCIEGRPFTEAMYTTCKLYLFDGDEAAVNIYVEIARWLAPAATAGGIVIAVGYLRRSLFNSVAHIKRDSTAVYGPEDEKQSMLKMLGTNGIDGGEKFVTADRYLLLDSEETNLAFFDRHLAEIDGKDVFARCDSLSAKAVSMHNLHLFCAEELAAAAFWKEHCIYSLSKEHGHQLKIAFIGFERLGRELLLSAVQNNIFDREQSVDYHIFGDSEGFCSIHHQLKKHLKDDIVFHSEQWYGQTEFLNSCDMVVVLQQKNQAELLRNLLLATDCRKIYVFNAADYSTDILEHSNRLVNFSWKSYVCSPDKIFGKKLFEKAKTLNLKYANICNGVQETYKNRELLWQQLDTFTRYSNISAADYNDIQRIILSVENQGFTIETMSAEWFEKLSELEHIRWCRYHLLNNWVYGKTADGRKDSENRIHPDLVPYSDLADSEKQKDRSNIAYLFSI